MSYIWQNRDWPCFRVDSSILKESYEKYIYQKGRTDQIFSLLSLKAQNEYFSETVASDVVASNEIEGVSVSYESVYSSALRALKIETDKKEYDRNAEALANLALSVRNGISGIDEEKIKSWHKTLFQFASKTQKDLVIGEYREKPVYVMRLSGRMEEEIVYEAVPAENVKAEMQRFCEWLKASEAMYPPVIRSAIASLWFVSVHPFTDGNGRISRLISDMVLSGDSQSRYFSVSSEILSRKKEYYAELYQAQHSDSMECTRFVKWFMDLCTEGMEKVENVFHMKMSLSSFMATLDPTEYNSREITMMYKVASGSFKGKLTVEKWCKMTKCTTATAARDLTHLTARNILIKLDEKGRAQTYVLNPEAVSNLNNNKQ